MRESDQMTHGKYILVVVPDDYPGKRYRGRYAYEHHVVWWVAAGEVVDTSVDVLHHEDGNGHNNAFSNLVKKKKSDHTRDHHTKAETVIISCDWCGCDFTRTVRRCKMSQKAGYFHSFCCRSHQIRFNWKKRKKLA